MGYDRGNSFPFDFEPVGVPFGLKSKGKLSPRSYPIQCERKWNTNFLSEPGKPTTVPETSVWRYPGPSLCEGYSEAPRASRQYCSEGFKGNTQLVP